MIRIAIVEDEDVFASQITEYLQRYQSENQLEFQVTRYRDGEEISADYSGKYDIILMDIEMGLMNGMEAAEVIRQTDEYVQIIFITNMAQYALQGYKVGALDYVLKPIEYTPFSQILKKALRGVERQRDKYITISMRDGAQRIRVNDILWIESQRHRLTFHTADADYETTVYSMKEMEDRLGNEGFLRCNSGSLVNLRRVCGIQGAAITVGKDVLTVSRGRKTEFMEALVRYMTE